MSYYGEVVVSPAHEAILLSILLLRCTNEKIARRGACRREEAAERAAGGPHGGSRKERVRD